MLGRPGGAVRLGADATQSMQSEKVEHSTNTAMWCCMSTTHVLRRWHGLQHAERTRCTAGCGLWHAPAAVQHCSAHRPVQARVSCAGAAAPAAGRPAEALHCWHAAHPGATVSCIQLPSCTSTTPLMCLYILQLMACSSITILCCCV